MDSNGRELKTRLDAITGSLLPAKRISSKNRAENIRIAILHKRDSISFKQHTHWKLYANVSLILHYKLRRMKKVYILLMIDYITDYYYEKKVKQKIIIIHYKNRRTKKKQRREKNNNE
jgi:hypothetical protein